MHLPIYSLEMNTTERCYTIARDEMIYKRLRSSEQP